MNRRYYKDIWLSGFKPVLTLFLICGSWSVAGNLENIFIAYVF